MHSETEKHFVKTSRYHTLLASIKKTIQHGLLVAQKELEYQRLKTYWQIGKEILKAVDLSKGDMVLGERLYLQISAHLKEDLHLSVSPDTLFRAVQFNRDHPVFPKDTPLTFTHYLILHRVQDTKKRNALEKRAIKENLTTISLKNEVALINAALKDIPESKSKKIAIDRGELYVYSIVPQLTMDNEKALFIDCGFKIFLPVNGEIIQGKISTQTQQKRVIKASKENGTYQIALHKKYAQNLFTYAARVLKVVDGDTLDVRIDVGFGIHLNERIRLKNINAPEIKTLEGKKAKAFLEKYLTACPLIVIRTDKAGMYGRWIADVFVLPKSKDIHAITLQGEYLNQLLLDEGLVQRY